MDWTLTDDDLPGLFAVAGGADPMVRIGPDRNELLAHAIYSHQPIDEIRALLPATESGIRELVNKGSRDRPYYADYYTYRADTNMMEIAVGAGNVEAVMLLLSLGADIEGELWNKRTPLLHATVNEDTKMVKALIDAGANTEAPFKQHRGEFLSNREDSLLQHLKDRRFQEWLGPYAPEYPIDDWSLKYEGLTAYDYAKSLGKAEMAQTLAEGGARHSFVQCLGRKARHHLGLSPRVTEVGQDNHAATSAEKWLQERADT